MRAQLTRKSASRARQPMKKKTHESPRIWLAQTTGAGRNLLLARGIRTFAINCDKRAKCASAKFAFLLQFCCGSPKAMKILLAARCRSAYFPRMATIPLAHFAICKLQENCKSSPFSETALIFIHLKRCTIEILGRQGMFDSKVRISRMGMRFCWCVFPVLGQASASLWL